MPNEGLTRRDDRDGHKAPYNTPYEMLHSYARFRASMMVSYLHDSTTLRRISDLEHSTVKAQSDVIFDKGVHDDGSDKPEMTTLIDCSSMK
jgi:hypothetical protein